MVHDAPLERGLRDWRYDLEVLVSCRYVVTRSGRINVKHVVPVVHGNNWAGVAVSAVIRAVGGHNHAQIVGPAAVAADKDICFRYGHRSGTRHPRNWRASHREPACGERGTRGRVGECWVVQPERYQRAGRMDLRRILDPVLIKAEGPIIRKRMATVEDQAPFHPNAAAAGRPDKLRHPPPRTAPL